MIREPHTIDDPHELVRMLAVHDMRVYLPGGGGIRHSVHFSPKQNGGRVVSYEIEDKAFALVCLYLTDGFIFGNGWRSLMPLDQLPEWAQVAYLEGLLENT